MLASVSNSFALPVSRKTRLAYPAITTGTHQTYHASLPQTGHTRHENSVSPNTPKKTLTSCLVSGSCSTDHAEGLHAESRVHESGTLDLSTHSCRNYWGSSTTKSKKRSIKSAGHLVSFFLWERPKLPSIIRMQLYHTL
jgi:hypothetical protein